MSLSMLHSLMFKVKCGDSKGGGLMNLLFLDWEKLMHES